MSNPLAIATVTETLRQRISDLLAVSGVTGASVTALRPDAPAGLPSAGVNIFLYQITPNPAWRNADLPTRRPDASLLRRPQAAVDLHYLLSFYGDDATLEQHRLLGITLLELHAAPVLSREVVRQVQMGVPYLIGSNLADQEDLVRVRPANLSLEEMNRLWMTFPKVDYILSMAYIAGVVLIESDDTPPAPALPVLRWRVMGVPFSLASIDSVAPQPVDLSYSAPGQISLIGSNLDPTGDVSFTTPGRPEALTGTILSGAGGRQLVVALPPGLRPGVNTVQLTQFRTEPSSSSEPARPVAQSNVAAFIIRPAVVRIGAGPSSGELGVVVFPPVGPRQRVSLLLNQTAGAAPQAFALPAAPRTAETDTFSFNISGLPTGSVPPDLFGGQDGSIPRGNYLVRFRVDGAESPLMTDIVSGKINGPTVTI